MPAESGQGVAHRPRLHGNSPGSTYCREYALSPEAPGPARRVTSAFLAALILFAITAGFYWRLAIPDQFTWFNQWDMCALEIPRLQFEAEQIHAGRFPLWDPHIWSGQPMIGQTQPGTVYPLNLLL